MTEGRSLSLAVVVVVVVVVAVSGAIGGCGSDPETVTMTEFLEQNTTLLDDLGSFDASERNDAIRKLKGEGREQGTLICLYLLMEQQLENPRIEVVVARLLADWKDPRAIPFLVKHLTSSDAGVVRLAVEGLRVYRGNERLIEVLEAMLDSAVVHQRRVAADVLQEIGGNRAIASFAERYRGETDADVRARYLIAIARSRSPRRREFLIEALVDSDDGLRVLAWNALKKDPGLPPGFVYHALGDAGQRASEVARLRLWIKERGNR